MSLRLLLLPLDPEAAVRCLHVDGDGRVVDALELSPGQALPAMFACAAEHSVLVVPGSEVAACLTDLPARDPGQALAASRLLLADRVAEPVESLHIAIGPLQAGQPRLLAWVKPETLRQWLDRAAALGMDPDRVIPDYLALPVAGEAGVVAAEHAGQWLVRGPGLAFSAEPAVARQVLGERPFELVPERDSRSLLARGATAPGLDLLQHDFSRRKPADQRQPERLRLVALASMVLLSPIVLVLADALRYDVAARSLQRQADTLARPFLDPGTADDSHAVLASVLEARQQPERSGLLRQALFESIAATEGARLDALQYGSGIALEATVVHATPGQLEQLREALALRGASVSEQSQDSGPDGLRSRLTLEQAP